ncbi:MAG: hypothetical protein M1825_006530 [Sarcosagium campestre]|nr:MAG: hypothetical protein M1825_006530 [Sarcosagium campestre]
MPPRAPFTLLEGKEGPIPVERSDDESSTRISLPRRSANHARDGSGPGQSRRAALSPTDYTPPANFPIGRVLVTGGAGFLGSHLVDALMAEGHTVIVIDNFMTGCPENLAAWMDDDNFTLVQQDVCAPFSARVDYIFHLACPASSLHNLLDPIHTLETCYRGTKNMLELAKRYSARILIASSSEVYGDAEVHPQRESYNGNVGTWNERACHDEGKRIAESLAYAYQHEERVDVRLARIFNTFGERMAEDDGRLVPNFIIAALKGEDIEILGDGCSTRSFCYVSDMVEGLQRLMASTYTGGPVNLGNNEEYSVRELAYMILDMVHSEDRLLHRTNIAYAAAVSNEPRRRCPDTSLAYRIMLWRPNISVHDGLQKTIDDLRARMTAYDDMERELYESPAAHPSGDDDGEGTLTETSDAHDVVMAEVDDGSVEFVETGSK